MVDQEISRYVQEQMKAGFSLEEIRNYLVLEGFYPAQDVDEVIKYFRNMDRKTVDKSPEPPPKGKKDDLLPKKKGNKKFLILYILIVIFGLVVALKALSYFEIFDAFAIIGFDPFTELGKIIGGK